jgi:hypothetical protein
VCSVGGDDRTGDVDPVQQRRERGDLVGLAVHHTLAQHHPAGLLECREQMHRAAVGPASTACALAVDSDHPPPRGRCRRSCAQPGRQHRVESLGIDGLRISHDPIRGAQAFTELTAPIVTDEGTRIPALRFGDARVHALLQALLIHRLLPHGFTNRDLRTLLAPLLGTTTEDITAGKMTYDLRRLRAHGLIHRIPHSRRYQITDAGLQHALFFTHAHDHLLRTGLAELTDPDPPAPSRLRAVARSYQAAFGELAHYAHLAA